MENVAGTKRKRVDPMQQTSSPKELEAVPIEKPIDKLDVIRLELSTLEDVGSGVRFPALLRPAAGYCNITSAEVKNQEPVSLIWAYRLFWLTFLIFFMSTAVGKLWDRIWHLTVRFDTFWSPPHFFVFVMTVVSGLMVASIASTPRLRSWFGPVVRAPIIHWHMAGTLVILGTGLIVLCIDIMLDNFWHAVFGLDETQWSVPHDVLTWCWFTIIMGFIAARMAFRPYRPIGWLTKVVIGFLILEFLCPPILGPFYLNYSPHLLNAMKNVPIVRGEPTAQHMYRIYLMAGITRQTNALFIPEAALFAGAVLALLHKLDARARIFLFVPFIWSLSTMGRDLYTLLFVHYNGIKTVPQVIHVALNEPSLWVPVPLFVAAVISTLLWRSSFAENRVYILTGTIFAVCTFLIWHNNNLMLLLAIPAAFTMVLGSWIGQWFYGLMERPSTEKLMRFMSIACGMLPACWGIVDLVLRHVTP